MKDLKKQLSNKNIKRNVTMIDRVYMAYVRDGKLIMDKTRRFEALDERMQEDILKNIKKLLSGKMDVKIFNKEFEYDEHKVQMEKLITENSIEECKIIAEKIIKELIIDTNYVLMFVKYKTYLSDKNQTFITCSINKTEQKSGCFVDIDDNKFYFQAQEKPIIKFTSPLEGFTYPGIKDGKINKNNVIYYSSKSNKQNRYFVERILGCKINFTAKEEKDLFYKIIRETCGQKIKPDKLNNLYESLVYEISKGNQLEDLLVYKKNISDVLDDLNIKKAKTVDDVYKELNLENHAFKLQNIISSKFITFENEEVSLNIKPQKLEGIKQLKNKNGELYLLIELSENIKVEGLNIDSEFIGDN